jgi:hypothetical protein
MPTKEVGHQICEKAVALKNKLEIGFLELGKLLKQIRDEKLYMPEFEAFWMFTEEKLQITESTASKMIKVYVRCILEWDISPDTIVGVGGWNSAYEITCIASSKEQAVDLFEKREIMPPSEWKKEVADMKDGGECDHHWGKVDFYQCSKCNRKVKNI